jgi:hypothetical protein
VGTIGSRRSQLRLDLRRPERLADPLIDNRPRAVDDRCCLAKIGAEHRPHDNGVCQGHQLGDEIGRFTARRRTRPAIQCLDRAGDHRVRLGDEAPPVERRLRETALPQPEGVFTRQQAVAESVLESVACDATHHEPGRPGFLPALRRLLF